MSSDACVCLSVCRDIGGVYWYIVTHVYVYRYVVTQGGCLLVCSDTCPCLLVCSDTCVCLSVCRDIGGVYWYVVIHVYVYQYVET